MKRFIRNSALFALPVLVVACLMEIIAEAIPNSYSYKRAYMEANAGQLRTLVLGSSYVYDGIDPSALPDAFNLANSSQTIEDDYRLLARYIGQADSLQTVIEGIGYSSLAMRTQDHRRLYYTLYMDLYPRWPVSRYSFEVFNPELLTKKIIKYTVSRDITRCDSLGQRLGHDRQAVQQQTEFWNKDLTAMVTNDRMDIEREKETIAYNQMYLDSIAALCRAHDVRLVVVAMPVLPAYRELLPAEQVELQQSILANLPPEVIRIDASQWSVPDEGWYNATHLTREASTGFTKQLYDSLR